MIVESPYTIEVKDWSVATWSQYFVAPDDALQLNTIEVGSPVEPLEGDASEGADGEGVPDAVEKLQVDDQLLVRSSVDALTRQ